MLVCFFLFFYLSSHFGAITVLRFLTLGVVSDNKVGVVGTLGD